MAKQLLLVKKWGKTEYLKKKKVHFTFLSWQKTDFDFRDQKMKMVISILKAKKEEFVRLMTIKQNY